MKLLQQKKIKKLKSSELKVSNKQGTQTPPQQISQPIFRIKGAEADSQVSRLHGEGIAMEREAVISGLKRSVAGFSDLPIGVEHVMNLLIMAQHTGKTPSSNTCTF